MSLFVAAAAAYGRKGMNVFRLQVKDKKPIQKGGFKTATLDPTTIVKWWGFGQLNNIGIATGLVSGFWVLDIDGAAGDAAIANLEALHGALPDTPEQTTGKGRQLCFAWDPERPVRNMSKRSRQTIGDDIDVRGDGGYIVAPPSIHPGDAAHGVPPGRVYTWCKDRSPHEIPFAKAPEWLMDLVAPVAPAAVAPSPAKPRMKIEGRATPYGEAALDRACQALRQARPGTMNDSLFLNAVAMGRLCAGGEIGDDHYALDALRNAGRDMVGAAGKAWTERREEDTLQRGFKLGLQEPRSAPDRHGPQPATAPRKADPRPAGDVAKRSLDAGGLWTSARSAWCKPVTDWLERRGLDPSGTEALSLWRAHPSAPWGHGQNGPSLIAPLIKGCALAEGEIPDALAILPLHPDCEGFANAIGDHDGRSVALTPLDGIDPLIVGYALQDSWALAQAAPKRGFRARAVVTPTLAAFAGGAVGDRYGRVDPDTPNADPEKPAWTLPGQKTVYLAVRRDLRPPPLKIRKSLGGTMQLELNGEAAARFYGALAEQHWRDAGANAVRLLAPRAGTGFNTWRG